MDDKAKAATPLVEAYDRGREADEPPKTVDTQAPVSTDADGEAVDLPDLGGRID